MILEQLQTFLNQNEIPKIKGKPQTFLGIAKQPHYENVLSNMLAFYFDVNEEHQCKDLFIKSLLELINDSRFETFLDFDVYTEYGISTQKRIDIVLQNDTQAIIIENKVYHHLHNDLNAYYKAIKASGKIGIVLSLYPISNINHPHFINITHLALLNKVMQNLGNYILEASDKYVVFLKDLYQNIINLSHDLMSEENINFYYKNQKKINELVTFQKTVKSHVLSELIKAGQTLESLNLLQPRTNSQHDGRLVFYVSPKHHSLFFTILYEDLLKEERTIKIMIELTGKLLKDRGIYKKEIKFSEEEVSNFADHFESTNLDFAHFILKEYELGVDDIANLSEFIQQRLMDDHMLSAFRKIENFLDNKKLVG